MEGKSSKDLPNLEDLIEQRLSDNPRIQMLKQMLEMQRQATVSEDRSNRARRGRALEQRAFVLLQERNREFADACGACPCFGESKRCKNCAGRGRPGWQAPDEELFLEYIGPALKRLGILGTVEDQNQAFSSTKSADSGDVHIGENNE